MQKVLLHTCCAPCSTYVIEWLLNNQYQVNAYFFNPNIHPLDEYTRRLDAMQAYARSIKIELLTEEYAYSKQISDYIKVVFDKHPSDRCFHCYQIRLNAAAKKAKQLGLEGFTTTLLISPFQKHEEIKEAGKKAQAEHGVEFVYYDFRPGYNESRRIAKEFGLYRQKYCGCVYSLTEKR